MKVSRRLLIAALALGGALLPACGPKSGPAAAPSAVPVVVAVAARKDVPVEQRVIGNAEAYSTVSVRALVSGELREIHFVEGNEIRKGELLFTIDSRQYQSDVRRAEANLARDLAAEKQGQANLARDTAEQRNAEVEANRYRRLQDQGIVSREEYDRARTKAEALAATLEADRAAIEHTQQSIRADRAAIENAKLQLEYCSIRAPMAGRTGGLLVHPGNLLRQNDTVLVTINQVAPLYVAFAVPEQTLGDIKRYMAAGKLQVEAISPDDEKRPVTGVLTFVDNAVQSATGTIRLKASFPNEERRLWPGQFVNVVLRLAVERGATVVPTQAIQTGQSGPFLFVIKNDLSAELRTIVPGRVFGPDTVIAKGVSPGEKVVVDGQLRLVPGARVQIKSGLEAAEGVRSP